jgi:hypothetical protein
MSFDCFKKLLDCQTGSVRQIRQQFLNHTRHNCCCCAMFPKAGEENVSLFVLASQTRLPDSFKNGFSNLWQRPNFLAGILLRQLSYPPVGCLLYKTALYGRLRPLDAILHYTILIIFIQWYTPTLGISRYN